MAYGVKFREKGEPDIWESGIGFYGTMRPSAAVLSAGGSVDVHAMKEGRRLQEPLGGWKLLRGKEECIRTRREKDRLGLPEVASQWLGASPACSSRTCRLQVVETSGHCLRSVCRDVTSVRRCVPNSPLSWRVMYKKRRSAAAGGRT